MKKRRFMLSSLALVLLAPALVLAESDSEKLHNQVKESIETFKKKDSSIKRLFEKSYGYVLFPAVGKGGFIVGGAGGTGEVYEQGKLVGTASLAQGSIGLQIGGQSFAEVVFFEDKTAMDKFKQSEFSVSAQVGAVAAAEGVAEKAKFQQGIAIFTYVNSGLMAEASVGGQKLTYKPLKK
jgi:lipid-binding SYLF domain-containing protein